MNKPDRRQELLDEAHRLFLQYGYKKTTLDDLAEAVGITKSSLYHYFANKEDLFRNSIRYVQDNHFAQYEQALNNAGPLMDALGRLFGLMRTWVDEVHPHMPALMGEINEVYPIIRDIIEEFAEKVIRLLAQRMDHAVEVGEYRPFPTEDLARILLIFMRQVVTLREESKLHSLVAQNERHYLDVLLSPYRNL